MTREMTVATMMETQTHRPVVAPTRIDTTLLGNACSANCVGPRRNDTGTVGPSAASDSQNVRVADDGTTTARTVTVTMFASRAAASIWPLAPIISAQHQQLST